MRGAVWYGTARRALCLLAVLPVSSFSVWFEDGVEKLDVPDDLVDSVA